MVTEAGHRPGDVCVRSMSILQHGSAQHQHQHITPTPHIEGNALTITRQMTVNTPSSEKYTTNAGRLKSARRSSSEWFGSGTMPNTAMSTAPPAMHSVLSSIQGENTSPRMSRAKKAFHSSETAPSGARITTGREAIWKMEPKRFEEMNMPGESRDAGGERARG